MGEGRRLSGGKQRELREFEMVSYRPIALLLDVDNASPPADVTIERIGDLLNLDLLQLRPAPMRASKLEPVR